MYLLIVTKLNIVEFGKLLEGYGKSITLFQYIKSPSMASRIHIVLENRHSWLKSTWYGAIKKSKMVVIGYRFIEINLIIFLLYSSFSPFSLVITKTLNFIQSILHIYSGHLLMVLQSMNALVQSQLEFMPFVTLLHEH